MSSATCLLLAAAFFGVNFDPAETNAPSQSRIFPINAVSYKMVQPDGKVRLFNSDPDRPGVILGERPWLGTIQKNVVNVWADSDATGGRQRTAFTFLNGQLRILTLDGKAYKFPGGNPKFDKPLESLWSAKKTRNYDKGSAADIWRKDTRLRLWFANPNSAGMLCAQVALVGLWLLLVGKWYRRIPGMVLFAIAFYGMVQTGSRGAMLGVFLGGLLMAAFALRRRLNLKTLMAAVAVLGLAVGLVAASGLSKRFTGTVGHVDPGNQRRLVTGKAAIRMFADAPFGWRGGEVPGRNAALNWYVFDDDHVIRTHLLTMAELGWFGGGGYVLFWALMLAWGVSMAKRGNALPVGEWAAFSAAGLFNPVYTEWELWAIPAVATVWSAWRVRRGITRKSVLIGGLVALGIAVAVVSGLAVAGKALNAGRRTQICASGRAAVVNGTSPSVWLVEDKPVLGGWGFPGREVMAYYAKNPDAPAIGYVYDIGDLPREVEKLVLPGRAAAEYLEAYRKDRNAVCHAKKTVFLSPAVGPGKMAAELLDESKTLWVAGSLALARDDAWRGKGEKWLAVMPGVERYVPNWPKIIFAW